MSVWISLPLAASQILSVPSKQAETIQEPSGLIAQAFTSMLCPERVWISRPIARSQIFSVLSMLAETPQEPSGLIAQSLIKLVCPDKV